MKFILILFFVILFSTIVYSNNFTLQISEVYPNPAGKDNINPNDKEFIEIYNFGNNNIDLTHSKILNSKNKSLQISEYFNLINSKQYLVIYPMSKFALKNSGKEEILLTNNDFIIDKFQYSYSEETYSWSRINNSWVLAKATPGKINFIKYSSKKKTKNNFLNNSHINVVDNKNSTKSEKLLNITNNNINRVVYESKDLKQSRLGIYLFLLTLTLVIISLLIERWKINKSKQG